MVYHRSTLYSQVIEIATEYLGSCAKQLIGRQIINHLNKNPEDLTEQDLNKLLCWIEAMAGLLLEDKRRANEFARRLKLLSAHPVAAGSLL